MWVVVRSCVTVVSAGNKAVVTVRGNFRTALSPGIHLTPPLISNTEPVTVMQSLEVTQDSITQDNASVRATGTIEIQVVDANKAFHAPETNRLYGFAEQGLRKATKEELSELAGKKLREQIGEMNQEYVLSETNWEEISASLTRAVDEQTEEWGIRVQHFTINDISLSDSYATQSSQNYGVEFE